MLMTLLGRECPELPAEVLFSDIEIDVLNVYAAKKTLPPNTTGRDHTIGSFSWWVPRAQK